MTRLIFLLLLASACGGDDDVAPPWPWADVPLELAVPAQLVGDVTGDGVADWVSSDFTDNALHAGPWPGTRWASVGGSTTHGVEAADVDGDGQLDLVIPDPYASHVAIHHGPIARDAVLDFEHAGLQITSDTGGGLTDLLGVGRAIGDVTGDGIPDLVLGAPAEREEGCLGSRDTVVLPGPLARGALRVEDATIRVSRELGSCLGEVVAIADVTGDGAPDLVLSADRQVHVLAGPLHPGLLTTASSRPVQGSLLAVGDLDGDGRVDQLDRLNDHLELRRGSGGVSPLAAPTGARVAGLAAGRLVLAELAEDGTVGAMRLYDPEAASIETLLRLPAYDNPSWAAAASAGDVDQDGRVDLMVGDRVYLGATP